MGRAFTSCMLHFLDEKGAILSSVPIKSKKLFENLQIIISSVSRGPQSNPSTSTPTSSPIAISCWNSPKKKRCLGKIDASLDLRNHDIVWHCLVCGNHGTIYKWKNTVFDRVV